MQLPYSGLEISLQQEHGECSKHRAAGCAGDSRAEIALAMKLRDGRDAHPTEGVGKYQLGRTIGQGQVTAPLRAQEP